jgi:hypothetical protein
MVYFSTPACQICHKMKDVLCLFAALMVLTIQVNKHKQSRTNNQTISEMSLLHEMRRYFNAVLSQRGGKILAPVPNSAPLDISAAKRYNYICSG